MFRKLLIVSICCVFASSTAYSAPSTSVEIKTGAEKLKTTLESMPFTKLGQGEPLYVFQFPDCSHCQAFYQDFKGHAPGVQMRHFFYAVSQKSANETAGLARHPRRNVYHVLMSQSQTAAPYDKNQKRLNAYNAVMEPLNEVIIPTLVKNGWPRNTLVAPTFIWEEKGKWYADGGYDRQGFEAILAAVTGVETAVVADDDAAARQSLTYTVKPGENFGGVEPVAVAENLAVKTRLTPQTILQSMSEIDFEDVGADLRGFRLGMTPAEAIATLKENGYAMNTPPHYYTLAQSAGLVDPLNPGPKVTASTPGAFTNKLSATNGETKDTIGIEFALPPAPNVVKTITRSHRIEFTDTFKTKKTSVDVYRKALIDKYGPPVAEYPYYNGATLKWHYPADGMDCVGNGSGPQAWVFRHYDKAAACATALIYNLAAGSDGVVTTATARLGNPGHYGFNAEIHRSLREEVRKLGNAAKREQATEAPEL